MDKKYFIKTLMLSLIGIPMLVNLSIVIGLFLSTYFQIHELFYLPFILILFIWITYIKRAFLPDVFWDRFLPLIIPFCYYMIVWIVIFSLSGYTFNGFFQNIFTIFTIPYFLLDFMLYLNATYHMFPFIQMIIFGFLTAILIFLPLFKNKNLKSFRRMPVCILIVVFLIILSVYQNFDSSKRILRGHDSAERVADEINLYNYAPFAVNNNLVVPDKKIGFEISKNYPKLDGATAAYPVYAALAQSIYKGLNENTVYEYVMCSKTNEAYERLINGEIDIFFGAEASKNQIEKAKSKGITLNMTAVGKEAFVFVVNKDNIVNSLTVKQIQDIYLKKINNWKDVGGDSMKIMAFQRPEGSGSQTIMEALVMNNLKLPPPLIEENANIMEGLVSQVAQYRNYSSAIGYTFRYFVTNMYTNSNTKLLAINGVEPTKENIENGSYPFTIDVYAVTAGTKNENSQKIIDWILTEDGQKFVEKCGYFPKIKK